MRTQAIELIWIVVKDLKAAVKFYTETVGLKLMEMNEEYNWAELQGHEGGLRLGIGQATSKDMPQPGSNAIPALNVENIEDAIKDLKKKGAQLIGEVMEVPGHVKMQSVLDRDGNHFQIVQKLGNF